MKFNAPIPGESLTGAPKAMPWERPPEVTDPKKALSIHMSRLQDPELAFDIASALEMGVTVKELTTGIIRGAVAQGVHTIDVGMLIAPAIHEAVLTIGKKSKVDFKEGLDNSAEREKTVKDLKKVMIEKNLNSKQKTPIVEEQIEEEPEVEEGFMKRRVK